MHKTSTIILNCLFKTLLTLDFWMMVCVVFNVLVFHLLGSREEAQVRVSETFMWLDDLQTPTDSPFCIDRRADRANWEYKSLYRGDITR